MRSHLRPLPLLPLLLALARQQPALQSLPSPSTAGRALAPTAGSCRPGGPQSAACKAPRQRQKGEGQAQAMRCGCSSTMGTCSCGAAAKTACAGRARLVSSAAQAIQTTGLRGRSWCRHGTHLYRCRPRLYRFPVSGFPSWLCRQMASRSKAAAASACSEREAGGMAGGWSLRVGWSLSEVSRQDEWLRHA